MWYVDYITSVFKFQYIFDKFFKLVVGVVANHNILCAAQKCAVVSGGFGREKTRRTVIFNRAPRTNAT